MRIVWGLICIALSAAFAFVLAKADFLLVDGIYALLAGGVTGVLFMIGSLVYEGSPESATKLLFFAIVGSVIGFVVAWAMALVLTLNLISHAALAFDLLVGVIGAAVAATFSFKLQRDSIVKRPYSANVQSNAVD